MFKLQVTEATSGQRVDKLLSNQLTNYPRSVLHRLFDQSLVWVNNQPTKPGAKARLGDEIRADLSPLDITIEDIDLPIVYEDANVIVIDKPSGIISHARGRYFDEPSVASFIRQKTAQPGDRAGIVHRLDRATSGIMITSKNSDTLSSLQKQFSKRTVKKVYQAIVFGKMKSSDGLIDIPIGRNPKIPKTFHATSTGKSAITRYSVIKSNDNYSLIELRPETGRTHQLRVHLNELGHPIVGDDLYGGQSADRLMLHACSLEITIPNTGRKVFTSETPKELMEYLNE